jgi:hypothetical protein
MATGPDESRRFHRSLNAGGRRTYEKVGRALTEMRAGASITEAARAAGTTPDAIRRYAGPWLVERPSGTIRALAADNMIRRLRWPTEHGIVLLDTADSRVATEVADFWNAVGRYLAGDRLALRGYDGRVLRVEGKRYRYPTAEQILEWARRGEVSFESIYEFTA